MSKILYAILLISSTLSAGWEDNWAEAVSACHEKRYDDAEFFLQKLLQNYRTAKIMLIFS